VVDRTVAKVASAALSQGIRRGTIRVRFVAVTCHYDVAEWLAPDWVLDMASGQLSRRSLRRPAIELEIRRAPRSAWASFARHHYLSGSLAPQARCYVATWNGAPVYFAATLPSIARKGHRRFTRVVTLPDFQGIGIGMRSTEAIARLYRDAGYRISITSSHPALVRHCQHSPQWKARGIKKTGGSRSQLAASANYRTSSGRCVVSFEFVGDE
jgi:GNAT superfamily N-acetyltransferase